MLLSLRGGVAARKAWQCMSYLHRQVPWVLYQEAIHKGGLRFMNGWNRSLCRLWVSGGPVWRGTTDDLCCRLLSSGKALCLGLSMNPVLCCIVSVYCIAGLVLASKIAPRAFGGVNSPDPLCARHALAVAALAARDMPGMYVEQMRQLVSNSLEIWHTTGRLFAATCARQIVM
jgi:hypothetical protein